jgi:hypothetical protein
MLRCGDKSEVLTSYIEVLVQLPVSFDMSHGTQHDPRYPHDTPYSVVWLQYTSLSPLR